MDTPGEWVAVITGERLDKIHDELKEGRPISIRLYKEPKEKDGAVVSGIELERLEEPEGRGGERPRNSGLRPGQEPAIDHQRRAGHVAACLAGEQ
jgi:hypothetical protein